MKNINLNWAEVKAALAQGFKVSLPEWEGKQWLQMFSWTDFVAVLVESNEDFDPQNSEDVSGRGFDNLISDESTGGNKAIQHLGVYNVNDDYYPLEDFILHKTERNTVIPYQHTEDITKQTWQILY